MSWNNIVTDILKVDYPIIQAPMLGVSTPEMAAAVSNAGGLGSLSVGGLSPAATRQLIHKTKSLTEKPFAVNLFAHQIPAYTEDDLEPMRTLLLQLANKRGYDLTGADLANFRFYNHLNQIDILIEEKISLVSFTFGCLDSGSIQALKQNACTLIGTATCVEEALFLQQQNIDMIVVQGIEAGGHRGTFLEDMPLPQVGLFSLLPQVKNAVRIPCIAAGGINSAETIKAAFELGAGGVQVGTAFIGTKESQAIASYKAKLNKAKDTDTTLTKAFSGRWARGIRNEMMHEIEQAGIHIPSYPLQNSLTATLRKLAQQNNDSEYTSLWAGQSAGKTGLMHTKEVFRNLVEQYEALYR
ncbi:nitronate monooxygenase family protein [Chitinophagaceae bacterium LB-8]|uniref:Nitronate monooxygenase n=1 Tax=Paraflavisolibacter caeni TaxID=2982496 RepID=A0A9X2XYR7_9BACT|nr:nitronate monooxygenase family protein [Paraflavisolibacter caeni]MCU7551371.1 nitronate monooxygenase family protein [Paraflavisolibacter caeni]